MTLLAAKRTRLLGAFVILCALMVSAGCGKTSVGSITGQITAMRSGQQITVSDALVSIWPTDPGAKAEKFEAEAVQNLRGVATTRANGGFEIGSLTSPVTMAEYALVKGWDYTIQVEVPGFYITSSTFRFDGGSQFVEVQIEEKTVDVLDTSGGVEQNERELQKGSVRRD